MQRAEVEVKVETSEFRVGVTPNRRMECNSNGLTDLCPWYLLRSSSV
jgi:hypothetical protein